MAIYDPEVKQMGQNTQNHPILILRKWWSILVWAVALGVILVEIAKIANTLPKHIKFLLMLWI